MLAPATVQSRIALLVLAFPCRFPPHRTVPGSLRLFQPYLCWSGTYKWYRSSKVGLLVTPHSHGLASRGTRRDQCQYEIIRCKIEIPRERNSDNSTRLIPLYFTVNSTGRILIGCTTTPAGSKGCQLVYAACCSFEVAKVVRAPGTMKPRASCSAVARDYVCM